jgi:ligand-binding sensor domain-containing protein
MQPELRREIKYLNLGMVNEAKVAMEVELTLEVEIREGQLEDAKLKEIRQLIRDNKTSAFSEDSQGTLWLGTRICVPNLKPIKESILREVHDLAYSIHPGSTKMYKDLKT